MKRSSEKSNDLLRIPQFEPGADLVSRPAPYLDLHGLWMVLGRDSVKVKAVSK